MIKNIKYAIFLILLKFQNLWNLINVFIKKLWKYLLSVSYDFKVWWVQENQRVMVPSGTTQGNSYPVVCMEMTKTLMCFVVYHLWKDAFFKISKN